MLIPDYHMHTDFSIDSDSPMESMIKSAIEKNIKEIAITDHVDFESYYINNIIDYDNYLITFNNLKEKYNNKINIIFGVEIGLNLNYIDRIQTLTNSYPFDFIIGSSHSVFNMDLYYDNFFENKTKEEAYNIYFTEMIKNITNIKNFCVYGHIDFISRYGIYEDNTLLYDDFKDNIDKVLKLLIENGKGIEINTSGFRYGINQTYPQFNILKKYKELGGEIITIGSDAHTPDYIGDHFNVAYDMLIEAGFKYITHFKNKKPIFEKL